MMERQSLWGAVDLLEGRNSVEALTRLTASCFHKGLGSTLHPLARLYASSHSGKRCANSISSDIRDLSWCKPSNGLPITRAERSEETAAGASATAAASGSSAC